MEIIYRDCLKYLRKHFLPQYSTASGKNEDISWFNFANHTTLICLKQASASFACSMTLVLLVEIYFG